MADTVRVFNRAPYTICYNYGDDEVLIESGRWVEADREHAATDLVRNPHLLIDWGVKDADWEGLLPWPHLSFAAPIDCWTGYGTVGERIAHVLSEHLPLRLVPVAYWNRDAGVSDRVAEMMDREYSDMTEWALCLTIPPVLPRVPSPRRILFSMWETSELPGKGKVGVDWAEIVNEWAEHLIVPCPEQAHLWYGSGVRVPIHICPLGVNPVYTPQARPPRPPDEPFTILSYGLLTSRKSPIETIQVCWKAFGDQTDWRLILKTRAGQLGAGGFTPRIMDDRVQVINEDYSLEQMRDLCYSADVGVMLSKFEGYGLPPLEMMATGLPVLISACPGHNLHCNPHYNIPIPTTTVVAADEGYANLGGWHVPDWDAAAEALRKEYTLWKGRGRKQSPLGMRGAAWIVSRCNWETVGRRLAGILHGIAGQGEWRVT